MDRVDRLLSKLEKDKLGLEIAPYFNPALPKRAGYPVLTLDFFDTATLKENATRNSFINNERIADIEQVDFVGDAGNIGEILSEAKLLGKLHYIVSSHNFEHLPNPIKFLQGAYDALAPNGILSMAIPDCRACFDHFRYPTRLSDWLRAFHASAEQPDPETLFDSDTNTAFFIEKDGQASTGTSFRHDPNRFEVVRNLNEAYNNYIKRIEQINLPYSDTNHVSMLFPEVMTLLLRDLQKIGLVKFEIEEISETYGVEFFVQLRKTEYPPNIDDEEFYAHRQMLLTKISNSLGLAPFSAARKRSLIPKMLRNLLNKRDR